MSKATLHKKELTQLRLHVEQLMLNFFYFVNDNFLQDPRLYNNSRKSDTKETEKNTSLCTIILHTVQQIL